MTIATVYVKGKSKKEINERIGAGAQVYGTEYNMFSGDRDHKLDEAMPKGTVIKIYDKMVQGTPYAKAYGNWDGKKIK